MVSALLKRNTTVPAGSISLDFSVDKAAAIFERQAAWARSEGALPVDQTLLELAFPHVTRGPYQDAMSFRKPILEHAVESATREGPSQGRCDDEDWCV